MRIKITLLKMVFLILLSGCASKEDSAFIKQGHNAENREFRSIMSEINLLIYDTNTKSELELDNIRRRYAYTLADTIEKLADKVSTSSFKEKMNAKDSELFTKHLNQLRTDAKDINQIAQNFALEKLDGKINDLKTTCNSCHALFRSY